MQPEKSLAHQQQKSLADERLSKAFDIILKVPRTQINVSVFESKFLPFLSLKPIDEKIVRAMLEDMSQKTDTQCTVKDLQGNLINEWLETVGSPYQECECIDAEGRVLFIIPPLVDTSNVVSEHLDKLPMLAEQASNQAQILPQMGDKFIREKILPLINKPKVNQQHLEMWNVIYKRYDLPLYSFSENGVTVSKNEVDDGTVNEFGFDD